MKTFKFAYGDERSPTLYTQSGGIRFQGAGVRLEWWDAETMATKTISKAILLRVASQFINFLANRHPFLCERLWCRWVGGFDNIIYRLEVRK